MEERPSLIANLRALPRPVWVLCAGTFVNRFGAFVIPFLAVYMTQQGYSAKEAGVAIAAYGIGHLLASAIGGYLADRIGRKNTIILSMFSAAGSMLLLSRAEGFWALVLLTALVGLTAEIYRPASSALLADFVPAGRRVTAFSAYRLAINAGWAFGPATAGFLAEHSFFWLFMGNALSSVVFGVLSWVALPQGKRHSTVAMSWVQSARMVIVDRRFLQVLMANFAVGIVFMQMSTTFSVHVTHFGFSPSVYGLLISLNGVLVVLFELPITSWTQRFRARTVIALGYVLIGTGFGMNAFAQTVPLMAFTMVVFTLGEMIAMPVCSAYVADLAPAHARGRYMGAFGLTWGFAMVLGPALGLRLFEAGTALVWLMCWGLGISAAMIMLRGERAEKASGSTVCLGLSDKPSRTY